jgi:hypothetical protein
MLFGCILMLAAAPAGAATISATATPANAINVRAYFMLKPP